jgi:hypothetical protein
MSEDSKKPASAILTENEEALFQIMKIVIATIAAGDTVKGKQLDEQLTYLKNAFHSNGKKKAAIMAESIRIAAFASSRDASRLAALRESSKAGS